MSVPLYSVANQILLTEINALRSFIQEKLRQFQLVGHYEADDILTEVFSRWNQQSKANQISYPGAWFRTVASNVIREVSGESLKTNSLEPRTLENVATDGDRLMEQIPSSQLLKFMGDRSLEERGTKLIDFKEIADGRYSLIVEVNPSDTKTLAALADEYRKLASLSELSDEEADRMALILDLAQIDPDLNLLLMGIDAQIDPGTDQPIQR